MLPMAVAAELMCQGAVAVNPGMEFAGYDEMRILKGIVLDKESVILNIYASPAEPVGDGTYKSIAEIKSDGSKMQNLNAKAEIILAPKSLVRKSPEPQKVNFGKEYGRSMEQAYEECLFHGEFLQALTDVTGWSEEGIAAISNTSKPVEEWFAKPLFSNWQSDPLMIDAAYQLMILWTKEVFNAPSLPNYAKSYRQYVKSFNEKPVIITAKASKKGSSSATANIDFTNAYGKVLARIEGYECTINSALEKAFKNRKPGV